MAVLSLIGAIGDFTPLGEMVSKVTDGRQLPGYRWRPLVERRRRRERLRKVAVAVAKGLVIGLVLYFGGEWFAGLPETDRQRIS